MFDASSRPRIFGVAPGIDFPQTLTDGIRSRLKGTPPDCLARVELFVNTRRMARRLQTLFQERGPLLLPRIRLITDLSRDPAFTDLPQPVDPLGRRLELAQLVKKLIEAEPDLAAQDAAFDLADSLSTLMEEMQGEGVHPSTIAGLDVGNHSAYWARSQRFLTLVQQYFEDESLLDAEARQRLIVERLAQRWETHPPEHPIVIAGSTGSRGTTKLFMEAVAKLPLGAIILPGFDFEMPDEIWGELDNALTGEDHPQYRFRRLITSLGLQHSDVAEWEKAVPEIKARNSLVSLALRPAPVTDGWLEDGPKLAHLTQATKALTLLEAPNARMEALSIALRLRKAVEDGVPAALITPDRTLTRQVTAALQRWKIEPDDSAGIPLPLTPPGRLLRQTADLMGQVLTPETLLALLKHPLVSHHDRDLHLLRTRDLELDYLRRGAPFPDRAGTEDWGAKRHAKRSEDEGLDAWITWLWDILEDLASAATRDLSEHLSAHVALTERLAAGPGAQGAGELWLMATGEKAQETLTALRNVEQSGGQLTPSEYADLIGSVLNREEVRNPIAAHPGVMIWGTLEARVQGADIVILAGLNDGVWPELPKPDPWLNRDMRRAAGLLLPDRNIGLAAHDFQQAIAAREVWLTRSVRDAEAETVKSRWLNRLTNLMNGVSKEGSAALKDMEDRGKHWLDMTRELERPKVEIERAPRPAPVPPVGSRPRRLSVTRIEKLIRDPYAIYARYILNLKPLDPLQTTPDAPLRGQALHTILEKFIESTKTGLPENARAHLMGIAQEVFERDVPWPATRAMWLAKLDRAADWFLESEHVRRNLADPMAVEVTGKVTVQEPAFTLEGRADRIDMTPEGELILYDYKTGALPTKDQQKHFNKQLPLLGAMAERGAFPDIPTVRVRETRYIGLGSSLKEQVSKFEAGELDGVWAEFIRLIAAYTGQEQGYAARRAVYEDRFDQDYDQLARYGEWDNTDEVKRIEVGT
ncbi:MAG: double-strand break repair protein AddB [Litoreibacter sp.]|nr:double-strand break repair protein AddB [Litoreibacter sp.]